MGQEMEVKFRTTPEQIAQIQADFSGFREISMETTYYDTPDGALGARRCTLRRRLENGLSLCAFKTPERNGIRGEWEVECDRIEAAIPALCKLAASAELLSLADKPLVPTCGARFTRLALALRGAELALDRGVLLGGGREEAFSEAELEYKSGSVSDFYALVQDFQEKYRLITENKSKFRRALALAKGEHNGPVREII